MTREELTNYRPPEFSHWIRKYLPDSSTGFMVTDLDFIIFNYKTRKIMFIELKTRGAKLQDWQRNCWRNIAKWVRKGIDDDWTFLGFHLIEFSNTCFTDGGCKFDYMDIDEKELQKKLSF